MKHILFLEGNIQIGKSTLILKNLISHMLIEHTGGFLCQRLTEEGKTKAFCIIAAEKAETIAIEYNAGMPDVFLEEVSGKWIKRDEVFQNKGIELLTDLCSKKLVLLDEIGGFELLIDEFNEKLYQVLLGHIPIIGVIKSIDNGTVMKNTVGIKDDYYTKYEKLRSIIKNLGGKIVKVNSDNILNVDDEIKLFLSNIQINEL